MSSATGSLLGTTLAGIYDGSVKNYVFYNDQLPDGSWSEKYGHSKGFFAFDSTSGFWVQHSIPKFPNNVKDGYNYRSGEMWYGQHAFCMSLTPAQLEGVAGVLQYAYPQVYDHALADTSLPSVNAVVAGQSAQGTTAQTVTAAWGGLTLLGKASAADEDMLDRLISPKLGTSMLSQSWLNSGGPIGGYCPSSGVEVHDIQALGLPANDAHLTQADHSKWAVAQAAGSAWWCALDNNHVDSQKTRSGLAVCMQQAAVAGLLRAAATAKGPCGAPTPPAPGPSPGPAPPPASNCCYYDDAKCVVGQTCCASSGRSYKMITTCEHYGKKHGCVWDLKQLKCIVGNATAPNATAKLSAAAPDAAAPDSAAPNAAAPNAAGVNSSVA